MANTSIPLNEETFLAILDYSFIDSPFHKKMSKEELEKITPKIYKAILAQIWDKITLHISKKADEDLFHLMKADHFPRCSSLADFLGQQPFMLNLNPKTLKNILVNKRSSGKVNQLLEVFKKVIDAEYEEIGQLKRLVGHYNIYNLHNTNKEKFQVSNVHISGINKSQLTYFSRRYKAETKTVTVEFIGNNKVLINLREDDCVLSFYAFVGALEHPQIIQAVYIYNNGSGHTIGSLAVFQKVESNQLFATPQRERDNLDWIEEKILNTEQKLGLSNFLINRASLLKTKLYNGDNPEQRLRFNFEDLKIYPGPYKRGALFYEDTRKLIGSYYIYFNEKYSSKDLKGLRENGYYSTVGKGLFQIYLEQKSGALKCRMKIKMNTKGEEIEFDGFIMNDQLSSPTYLVVSIFEKNYHHRFVNLILMKAGGNILFGSHNTMYTPVGELGTGAVVVARAKKDFDFEQSSPDTLLPCPPSGNPREDKIVNYLSRNSRALISPVTRFKDLKSFENLKYSGVYKMYSYGKDGIRVSKLKINKSGFVEHYAFSEKGIITAYGQVDLVRSVLNITLQNIENQRTGFCSVKVAEVAPSKGVPSSNSSTKSYHPNGTIYIGTFCGVTRRNGEYPIASKLVLEFVSTNLTEDKETIIPHLAQNGTSSYHEIPSPIINALKSKEHSFIGFLDRRQDIFRLSDLEDFNNHQHIVNHRKNADDFFNFFFPTSNNSDKITSSNRKEILKEGAQIFYERAVYNALVTGNINKVESNINRAISIRKSKKATFSQFLKEIHHSPIIEQIRQLHHQTV